MTKYFLLVKNINNSNSSVPSISSKKRKPAIDCNFIRRRGDDDKASCESFKSN